MGVLNECRVVAHGARAAGVLHQDAERLSRGQPMGQVGDLDLDAERLGARLDDADRLRMSVGVDHEHVGCRLTATAT